jgi:prepilin-type processing-associated H-X9-DG protein
LLLPALAKAKGKAYDTQCLSNFRQLSLCWFMYVTDADDHLPLNHLNNADSWIAGNLQTTSGCTNLDDIRNGQLFKYHASTAIYRCPALRAPAPSAKYGGPGEVLVRTLSMSSRFGALGDSKAEAVIGSNSLAIMKMSAIVNPSPSAAILFADESVATLDDGYFAIEPPYSANKDKWRNSATIRHGGGGIMSFADGHVEKWLFRGASKESFPTVTGGQARTDLRRVQYGIYPQP